MLNFIQNIGPTELIVLFAVVILIFGSRIAIGIGKTGGQTLKEMKKIKNELTGVTEELLGESDTSNQKGVSK